MLKKIFLFFVLAAGLVNGVSAQRKLERIEIVPENPSHQAKLIIKWAMLSLADPDNTLQFGVEFMLSGPWSIQQELGYGHFNTNNSISNRVLRDKEVWRSRTEIRLYLGKSDFKPVGSYFAAEFLYKKVNFRNETTIGRECEDGDCAFFEIVDYPVMKNVFGYHVKLGNQQIIQERIAIDFYGGLGVRYIAINASGVAPENNNSFFDISPTYPGKYTFLSACLGLKVGYLLYDKKQ